jgi:hypothetical protein
LLDVLSLRHTPDNLVHIYLVNPIGNLSAGGSSYVDSDPEPAGFIQWYGNVDANGRAWAHELGHLMSLDHVEIDYADERQAALRSNLMTKGLSMGRDLTDKQIGRVKGSKLVKQFPQAEQLALEQQNLRKLDDLVAPDDLVDDLEHVVEDETDRQ